MRGTFRPGAQLTEADIALKLGVSRGPLREAMQRLVQEGLLRSERNRGIFVVSLNPEDVEDIYLSRLVIEQAAVRRIFSNRRKHAGSSAIANMQPALDAMRTAAERGDNAGLTVADQQFHQALVQASASARLQRMANTLLAETRMCMTALEDRYELPQSSVDEHGEILDALRSGELDTTLKSIESHMQTAIRLLVPPDASTH